MSKYLPYGEFKWVKNVDELDIMSINEKSDVGFTVLDLSKWLMYDFHYNFIKKNFSAKLLFSDTDSLTYEIKPENIYKECYKWKDLFDFSNYSKDSMFYDDSYW